MSEQVQVAILMGSQSDKPTMRECNRVLDFSDSFFGSSGQRGWRYQKAWLKAVALHVSS